MRVAVVGGGISGLVAAYRLRTLVPDAAITVFDGQDRLGGTLHTVPFGGAGFDVGAEAFVGRRPEVPALLSELGLTDQLVHPSGLRPLVWSDGATHPLPTGTLMGIPAGPESMRGLVDEATLDRIAHEPPLAWEPGADVDVGTLVGRQFGAQVVERSVDPLLGGVYSGRSGSIGVRAALPTLAAALDSGAGTLRDAVAAALPPPSTAPVFGGLRDGYGALLDALVQAADAKLLLNTRVTRLDELDEYDAVVLAVPAPAAAQLLAAAVPDAARAAAKIPLASSALVGLALHAELPEHSGILVSSSEPLQVKAFTLSSRKWRHLDRGVALVRASFGRFGDAPLPQSDDDLIAAARADLAVVSGIGATPVDAVVQRWPNGLPQYGPGHVELVATIEAAVAQVPRLAVAGAYLHGVGVPACVASGDAAARRVAR